MQNCAELNKKLVSAVNEALSYNARGVIPNIGLLTIKKAHLF